MTILFILAGAVSIVGVAKSVHLITTDGHGPVPTRTYPNAFNMR